MHGLECTRRVAPLVCLYAAPPRREDIACRYPLNFRHDFKDLTKRYRLSPDRGRGVARKAPRILQRLQYNFRYTYWRSAIIVIHPRGYLSKLYPYLAGSPPRHSAPVLYQNKLKRQERARHFTDGYTERGCTVTVSSRRCTYFMRRLQQIIVSRPRRAGIF